MRKAIKDAYPQVMESIERSLETVRGSGKVILIGVGNTSGVGNSGKSAKKMEDWVDDHEKKLQAERKKKGKKKQED